MKRMMMYYSAYIHITIAVEAVTQAGCVARAGSGEKSTLTAGRCRL